MNARWWVMMVLAVVIVLGGLARGELGVVIVGAVLAVVIALAPRPP